MPLVPQVCAGAVRRIVVALLVIGGLGLTAAETGTSATVRVGEAGVIYRASAGETNDIAVTIGPGAGAFDVIIEDRGAAIVAGPGCTSVASGEVRCAVVYVGVELTSTFTLFDEPDSFTAATADFGGVRVCGLDVRGGPGADVLVGSEGSDCLDGGGGADTLEGLSGDDFLTGSYGEDALLGGSDADVLSGGTATDAISGGAGFDIVWYGDRVRGVRVDLDGVANDGIPGENDLVASDVEGITGGRGGDVLLGNDGSNFIFGDRGRDLIRGNGGNDVVQGGGGADDVGGGYGNDHVVAGFTRTAGERGAPRDRLRAGPGNDRLEAVDGGRDLLIDGGPGRDRAWIDRDRDRVTRVEELRFSLF